MALHNGVTNNQFTESIFEIGVKWVFVGGCIAGEDIVVERTEALLEGVGKTFVMSTGVIGVGAGKPVK